jgi:hypothetical protein
LLEDWRAIYACPLYIRRHRTRIAGMSSHGSHSYFEWQVSTLMLAYDVVEPIPRSDDARIAKRQQAVEHELHEIAHRIIPPAYRENAQLEFPPAIVMQMTRATLKRANEIVGQG